jgi:hypothetical protein
MIPGKDDQEIVSLFSAQLRGPLEASSSRSVVLRRPLPPPALPVSPRPSVADQFGSDRLHDLGGIVEPVVTLGSSMLIAPGWRRMMAGAVTVRFAPHKRTLSARSAMSGKCPGTDIVRHANA